MQQILQVNFSCCFIINIQKNKHPFEKIRWKKKNDLEVPVVATFISHQLETPKKPAFFQLPKKKWYKFPCFPGRMPHPRGNAPPRCFTSPGEDLHVGLDGKNMEKHHVIEERLLVYVYLHRSLSIYIYIYLYTQIIRMYVYIYISFCFIACHVISCHFDSLIHVKDLQNSSYICSFATFKNSPNWPRNFSLHWAGFEFVSLWWLLWKLVFSLWTLHHCEAPLSPKKKRCVCSR